MNKTNGAYISVGILAYTALIALLIPSQITDVTHEVTLIGSQWFDERLIPLVQSYSHFGPLSLWLANIWVQIVGSGFMSRVFDMSIAISFVALALYMLKKSSVNQAISSSAAILFLISSISIGALQNGPSPLKLGLLFSLISLLALQNWVNSGPSYWLFGKTQRNWRWLVLSGIMFSAVVFTEFLYLFVLVPVTLLWIYQVDKTYISRLRSRAIFISPVLLQLWIWISYFDSRNLMEQWYETSLLHISYMRDLDFGRLGFLILIPLSVAIAICLHQVKRENFYISKISWVSSMVVLIAIFIIPKIVLINLPLLILLLAINIKTDTSKIFKVSVNYAAQAALVLGLIMTSATLPSIRQEKAQSQLARAYVEQRMIDQEYVFYYGEGAGFYSSTLQPSTSFVDAKVFKYDRDALGLVSRFRGENEANSTRFLVVAKGSLKVSENTRINEYISDHYTLSESLSGFDIYKRE